MESNKDTLYKIVTKLNSRQRKQLIKTLGYYQSLPVKAMVKEVIENHLTEPFPEFTALFWSPNSNCWLLDTDNWPSLDFETKDVRDRVLYIYYQKAGRPHLFSFLDKNKLSKFDLEAEGRVPCATIV